MFGLNIKCEQEAMALLLKLILIHVFKFISVIALLLELTQLALEVGVLPQLLIL